MNSAISIMLKSPMPKFWPYQHGDGVGVNDALIHKNEHQSPICNIGNKGFLSSRELRATYNSHCRSGRVLGENPINVPHKLLVLATFTGPAGCDRELMLP